MWDADARIDRSLYPNMGEVMSDHGEYEKYDITRERMTEIAQDDYDNYVYPTEVE